MVKNSKKSAFTKFLVVTSSRELRNPKCWTRDRRIIYILIL
jgi:hypothetical protein